jgi:hypothetical protein
MFSRAERQFLVALAEPGAPAGRLDAEFPSLAYRRKLQWSIRKKVKSSLGDWELYARAAQLDSRLLPFDPRPGAVRPPEFSDPIVTVLRGLRSGVARLHRAGRKRPPTSSPRS